MIGIQEKAVQELQCQSQMDLRGVVSVSPEVARHDCLSPIFTSGKAPSGYAASDWSIKMNQGSGSHLATTIMVIHGKKNAIGATELATRRGD